MTRPPLKVPRIAYPGTAQALIAIVSSQIGYKEGKNNDTVYGKWYGLPNAPWCAMFLSWGSFVSGNRKNIPKHAYTPSGAAWFQKNGRWGQKPRVGAIAYYDTSGLGRISHVGVVDRVFPDGSWTSIEGNTNAAGSREGRVVRRQRRRSVGTRGGFGYPRYAKVPKPKSQSVPTPVRKTVAQIAQEVVEGKWGNGAQRKERLQKAGYPYAAVQHAVNDLLN